MGKILYPVGEVVTVRKDKSQTPYQVLEYHSGEKYPYRLKGCQDPFDEQVSVNGMSKFSKAGLRRYNPKELRSTDSVDVSPTRAEVDHGNAPKQPESSACNCYTKEEVDVLLARQWEAVVQMLSSVDGVAMEALRNTHIIAEMADRNFMRVAKQFKTLNHNDD